MAETKTKLVTKDKELTPAWYVAKRVIRAHGISYEKLAEKLGCSVTSVHDMLNYCPNVLRIYQMSKATGIPFMDFFDVTKMEEAENPIEGTDLTNHENAKAVAICPSCGETLIITLTTLFDQ